MEVELHNCTNWPNLWHSVKKTEASASSQVASGTHARSSKWTPSDSPSFPCKWKRDEKYKFMNIVASVSIETMLLSFLFNLPLPCLTRQGKLSRSSTGWIHSRLSVHHLTIRFDAPNRRKDISNRPPVGRKLRLPDIPKTSLLFTPPNERISTPKKDLRVTLVQLCSTT